MRDNKVLTKQQQFEFSPGISFVLSELPLYFLIDPFLFFGFFWHAALHDSSERRAADRPRARSPVLSAGLSTEAHHS